MEPNGEVYIVPGFGLGHLLPAMELCKHLSSRNYKTTLIMRSSLSSSVPSSLRRHPLIEIAELTDNPADPFPLRNQQMRQAVEALLSSRVSTPTRPVFAVCDVLMSRREEFTKLGIPTAAFFTSGACSAAMELGSWKAQAGDMKPGEIRILPGLPEDMALTYSDTKRRPHRPPHMGGDRGPSGQSGGAAGSGGPPGGHKFGLPAPGNRPPWVDEVDGSMTVLINTCDDLERPFIDYIANQIGKPVLGVGPLMPEQYWKSAGSILHDHEIRTKRQSNYSEDEVIQWLESKPRGSVIYVSFGSSVEPTLEEYAQLADALTESKWPFIWVIQPGAGRSGPPSTSGSDGAKVGYYPHGLDSKVGDRGLIISGWAPQLMILSHPSTGGFLSHCGWNSTVEAIGRGVPFLAWPIRGDQFFDAKLVVDHLKIGHMVSSGDLSEMVVKEDIVKGIERLMTDEEVHNRAAALGSKFERGFPASSEAALDAFGDFIKQKSS